MKIANQTANFESRLTRNQAGRITARFVYSCVTILIAAFGAGCATSRVAVNRPGLEKSKHIAVFVWKQYPFYNRSTGSGILGIGASIGDDLFGAISGETQKSINSIYRSGVYETFEAQFMQAFSNKLAVEWLGTNRVYTGSGRNRKVDVVASAKTQGYDAVFELTVWPRLEVHQGTGDGSQLNTPSLKTTIRAVRPLDGTLLWSTSYTTGLSSPTQYSPELFNDLAHQSVETAVQMYDAASR